jgi:hypothetical protein
VRRRPVVVAALVGLATAAAAGCGGPAGDLVLVQRFGSTPGARLDLRVTEDGRVSCNRGPLKQLTSAETIASRGIADDLAGKHHDGPAVRHLRLPPGPEPVLSYRVALEPGTVSFSDDSRHQPTVFLRIQQFTRQVATTICRLPR